MRQTHQVHDFSSVFFYKRKWIRISVNKHDLKTFINIITSDKINQTNACTIVVSLSIMNVHAELLVHMHQKIDSDNS